jgi:hypothetical protein
MQTYLPRFAASARLRGLTITDGEIVEDDVQVRAATAHDATVQIKLRP